MKKGRFIRQGLSSKHPLLFNQLCKLNNQVGPLELSLCQVLDVPQLMYFATQRKKKWINVET